jgi:hypothetical protein
MALSAKDSAAGAANCRDTPFVVSLSNHGWNLLKPLPFDGLSEQ